MSERRVLRLLTVALCMTSILLAAAPAHADPALPFTNDVTDKVFITGSPATFELMNDLAKAYMMSDGCLMVDVTFPVAPTDPAHNRCKDPSQQAGQVNTENYDHDVLASYYPADKSGLRQLCAQRTSPPRDPRIPYIDLVHTMSRPATGVSPADGFRCTVETGGQAGVVLRFIAFARDGMTWVRWPGGARPEVMSLRQYELHDIFVTCFLTHWNQVQATYNGEFYPAPAGEAIRIFTATPRSDERAMWDAFVGGASDSCIPNVYKDGDLGDGERITAANDARAVEEAINDPNAANEGNSIFYFSVARHTAGPAALKGSSVLGSADISSTSTITPVAPTEANIASGLFPFSRYVYMVLRNSGPSPVASSATRRFTNASNSTNDQTQGWLCKPESAHSEPPGTPGPGVENLLAAVDYGAVPVSIIRQNGFVPLPDDPTTGRRCLFADVPVS